MAVDMFIKIGDIKGESVDAAHKDEVDVLSWSWALSQSGTTHTGQGGGSGKVSVQDLSLTKYVDSATPLLMKMCANGAHIGESLLTVRKAGENPLEYIKIKMTDAIVASISTGGGMGEDRLVENLVLNFAKVEFIYTPQAADGGGGGEIPMGWDIAGNVEM